MAPRFDPKLNSSIIAVRRPLGEVNRESKALLAGTAEHPQGSNRRYLAVQSLSFTSYSFTLLS